MAVSELSRAFRWKLKRDGVIAPDERLPWPQTIALGAQHVFAMFGATVLVPILMGFDANTAILFSGIGTLIFFVITGGRVPSYLGSSFSFIAVVTAATTYAGTGLPNQNIPVALGGIIAAGVVCALIGLLVMAIGTRWIETLMPPAVTGAVVMVIGLNLAPIAVGNLNGGTEERTAFNQGVGLFTALAVGLVAVYAPGILRRLPILVAAVLGYLAYFVLANGLQLGPPIDFGAVNNAPWIGLPELEVPKFQANAISLIAPVALILIAENLGHVKAVAAMTGRNLDRYMGRAFLGDGVATIVAGFGGGTGVTTYAENIGVMAVTKIYSTLAFVIAGLFAILLGFSPKFGALIGTIPSPVLGGMALILFGLIAATGARIWNEGKVDLSRNRNLITIAATLILGAGDFSVKLGQFELGGIGTATLAAIVLYQVLREREAPGAGDAADAADAAQTAG
jgi:uracil-xanthine permease